MQALGKQERPEVVLTRLELLKMRICTFYPQSINISADRVIEMFSNTPAFSGISGAIDLFQPPPESNALPTISTEPAPSLVAYGEMPILHEIETYRPPKNCRKRKRTVESERDSVNILKPADLLPLQREVLQQQMAVFSAQLELIAEQRILSNRTAETVRKIIVVLSANPSDYIIHIHQ